jgi:hypothetical protein
VLRAIDTLVKLLADSGVDRVYYRQASCLSFSTQTNLDLKKVGGNRIRANTTPSIFSRDFFISVASSISGHPSANLFERAILETRACKSQSHSDTSVRTKALHLRRRYSHRKSVFRRIPHTYKEDFGVLRQLPSA